MFTHILLPTDGSALSTRAAKVAIRLARAHGARVTTMHVIAPFEPAAYFDGFVPYPELYSPADYDRIAKATAAHALGKVEKLAKAAKVRCHTATVIDPAPWAAITRAAKSKRCDLIVMASHGRRGVAALVLGSETTKVLTHSRTPVLVCR